MPRISNQKTGVAGEYFVAAELSKRGLDAGILLRNSEHYDILAVNHETRKQFCIQVKTTWNRAEWPMNQKAEVNFSPNHYYVFVVLFDEDNRSPDYWIIPSETVAKNVKKSHADWLSTPGKKGQPHNDSPMRKLNPNWMEGDKNQYLNNWSFFNQSD